ncbi:TetR family transcriptional regulator [Paraeggerthella hongkongensis]|uniref:TetR family transcriptional regulator n=1 Tax=Paraeggerthella sp. TaxID=2897350 RepID=UPI000DF7BC68|nr:TetR family transcriptional regulator [Paraeggerthella hongkongensis]
MDGAASEGLRYRKKLKARLAVERAALELVIEHGFDGVTVEDICARAEISKKTFFNYFSSKASAVMGWMDAFPDEARIVEILEERAQTCYLDVLVDVVGARLSSGADESVMELRREALCLMPQLFFQGQRDILAVQHSIAQALRLLLTDHPERRMLESRPIEEEALVASSTAISLARTRAILHVRGDDEPSVTDTRRMIANYLLAGDAASA